MIARNGFDPANLPLPEILFGYRKGDGKYTFLVTLTAPDGSQFIAPNDTNEFFIVVAADGKIMSLHPGVFEGCRR